VINGQLDLPFPAPSACRSAARFRSTAARESSLVKPRLRSPLR